MDDPVLNDIEVTPLSVVKHSAREFAAALTATPQFVAFEAASEVFEHDSEAQKAYQEFQAKQQEIKLMTSLNAVTPEERAKFEQLRLTFQNQPSVIVYIEAQEKFIAICQAAGDILSNATGLNFGTSASSSGCC
jgi:cell fate (sporulation/competence/biofilm development) regulator YlbF (YheA/YmcA/DUF963 family)